MNNIELKNAKDYERYLVENVEEVRFQIVEGIQDSFENRLEKALVHEILITEQIGSYKVYIQKEDWFDAFDKSLIVLQTSEQIDRYLDALSFFLKNKEILETYR